MSNPIILSDDDEDNQNTPLPYLSKKPRIGSDPFPTVFVIDDDPTPQKPRPASCSPSFVAETPMSDISIVKCTMAASSFQTTVFHCEQKFSEGNSGFVCLESENDESDSSLVMESLKKKKTSNNNGDATDQLGLSSRFTGFMDSLWDNSSQPVFSEDNINQVNDTEEENFSVDQMSGIAEQERTNGSSDKKSATEKKVTKKKMAKEERIRLIEEKKMKKQQDKLERAALKAQAAELKKLEKEKQKWEKGKFALKSIIAEFDAKVVEQGSIGGGHLLSAFADKGLKYRITTNLIEKSIVWTMSIPENISQLSPEGTKVQYVLVIYEAEEFCNLVSKESLFEHVARVQSCYPSYTVCCLTNRLMTYINKREKEQYKNPENHNSWRRPPIEEVLTKLTTHFFGVHQRHCIDEAELAEHIVGLTCSLASCQFRKRLTRLSINANGSLIAKDSIDKNLIKKSPWLKALVAIPKVQPRFAVAIWKKYPTMKSLLQVYMDPSKSVHEKEFLLENLTVDGLLGGDRRVGQICSKRVYRILMAQSGSSKTDDVENGSDFFRDQ